MRTDRRKFIVGSSGLLAASTLVGAASLSEANNQLPEKKRKVRLVDTEVHFAVPEMMDEVSRIGRGLYSNADIKMCQRFIGSPGQPTPLIDHLYDCDEGRIKAMDDAGVDVQVLSLAAPGVQMFCAETATSIATAVNDRLADIVKKHPTRLAGMATFAPQDPKASAQEIDRAINKLKLNGLLVNSHTDGEYLDDKKYWPILEAAEAVNAPLYIHPRGVPDSAAPLFQGDFGGAPLNVSVYSWAVEVGLHATRLICSGVFERFPNLKIVLGHMGEAMPYWFFRMDYYANLAPELSRLPKKPSEYFKRNFMITTSGVNDHSVLEFVHKVLGPNNIMYASDWPYQRELEASANFMNTAPLPEADVEQIAHGNAERIYRLAAA